MTQALIPADDDDWPDWRDVQRNVWARIDGIVWHGRLQADDFHFNGVDETPIWSVETADHGSFSLADASEWGWQ